MGLGNKGRGSGVDYLSIYGGEIVREWRKARPSDDQIPLGKELQEREISQGPNKGNTVWFIGYDYVTGTIDNIELDDSGNWGASINITIKDIDETFILQLKADSSYGTDFLMKLPNIDLSQEVSFEPWSMTPDEWLKLTGKSVAGNRSGLTIRQGANDDKVEKYYTKDDPKGLPEIIIKQGRGGTKVDSDDRDEFLLDRLEEYIAANFGGTASTPSSASSDDGGDQKASTGTSGRGKNKVPF